MGKFLTELLRNPVFVSAALAWFFGQGSKMIIDALKGNFSASRLTGGGGMPSAHSATVTGLAVSAALVYGGSSFEFVIAMFFAIIVIYDAQGVRYETGEEARVLNRMRKRDEAEGREPVQDHDLTEKIGHTMPELLAGIAVGAVTAIIVCAVMR